MEIWSKTILSVYKYLEALSNSIDDLVLKKSINSAFYSNFRHNSCYETANKIMQLTERKVRLINIKVLVEDALERLPLKSRQLLMLVYVDGAKSDVIADLLHISPRTFFRKKNEAITSFSKQLIAMGYNERKLESMFCGEHWLKNLYNKNSHLNSEPELKAEEINKIKFFRSVLKEFDMAY